MLFSVFELLKEIFSDFNNIILWHELNDINKKKGYLQNSVDSNFTFQVMHDYVCFIAPIDYCVK